MPATDRELYSSHWLPGISEGFVIPPAPLGPGARNCRRPLPSGWNHRKIPSADETMPCGPQEEYVGANGSCSDWGCPPFRSMRVRTPSRSTMKDRLSNDQY